MKISWEQDYLAVMSKNIEEYKIVNMINYLKRDLIDVETDVTVLRYVRSRLNVWIKYTSNRDDIITDWTRLVNLTDLLIQNQLAALSVVTKKRSKP